MKTLFLLRHAKSSWAQPPLKDFERPLNARGRDAAVRMGRELAQLGIRFDRVIASPARRVVETLEQLTIGYGQPITPQFDMRIYHAAAGDLIALAAEFGGDAGSLLIVGHNPTMHELALGLTGDGRLGGNYPTGALAEILLPAGDWSEVGKGGKLGRFIRPRELD